MHFTLLKYKFTCFNIVKRVLFLTINNKESLFSSYKLFSRSFSVVISKSLTIWFNNQMGSEHLIMSTKKSNFYVDLLCLKYLPLIIRFLCCRKYGTMLSSDFYMFLFKDLIDYKLYLKICLIIALLWQLQRRD